MPELSRGDDILAVLITWHEIAGYLRKSVSWAKQAYKEDGLPVYRCIGSKPSKKVWTSTTLIDIWLAKKILEQKNHEM